MTHIAWLSHLKQVNPVNVFSINKQITDSGMYKQNL